MKPNFLALGRMKSGVKNKTETAYAEYLESEKVLGNILWYKFEGITLKLADDTRYTPDFFVMNKDRELECHEVKGAKILFQSDAKTKTKVSSEMFPFRFIVVFPIAKKDGGGWETKEF